MVSGSVRSQRPSPGAWTSTDCFQPGIGISCRPTATCFCEARPAMNARTVARSALIRTAAAFRVDDLALGLRRWLVRAGQSPRMLVIEMHETPARDEALFRQQLDWAA